MRIAYDATPAVVQRAGVGRYARELLKALVRTDISDEFLLSCAAPTADIAQLLEQGLETLHVRKPGYSLAEMRQWLSQIPALHHPRLMLHQHHELAQEFRVKGLHFPEAVRATAATTPKEGLLFSTSFHQLQELPKPHPLFDYAFLSPVFDSISKEGYTAAFAEDDLRAVLQRASAQPWCVLLCRCALHTGVPL